MSAHYFSETPSGPEHRRQVEVEVWGRPFTVTTANGVFAGDRLDRGTEVLLRESAPPTGSPTVLDLGCGYGPVALGLALACPGARVDAVDVNERALLLTRDNAEAVGAAGRVHAVRPAEVPDELQFAEVWSNPPIRVGKAALHDLLRTWLPRLAPEGEACLVVQRNLGSDSLQRWVEAELSMPSTRHTSNKGFRVLRVTAAA